MPSNNPKVWMPIRKDVKCWIAQWLGRDLVTLVIDLTSDSITEIHKPVELALSDFNPAEKDNAKDILAMSDKLTLVLPPNKYLSQHKLVILEETWYQFMISQICTVAMARKEINAMTAKVDVFDEYRRVFGIEMSDDALGKAVNRVMHRRDLKKFDVIPRRN